MTDFGDAEEIIEDPPSLEAGGTDEVHYEGWSARVAIAAATLGCCTW
jgi:hypothetical protein